jgi:hypothetical protein
MIFSENRYPLFRIMLWGTSICQIDPLRATKLHAMGLHQLEERSQSSGNGGGAALRTGPFCYEWTE